MSSSHRPVLPARRARTLAALVAGLVAVSAPAVVLANPSAAAPGLQSPARPAAPALPAAPTIEDVQKRIETLQLDVERASEDYNETRERLASVAIRAKASAVRLQQQKAAVASTRDQLGRLAAELYRQGELSSVQLVMSHDPDDLLARAGLGTTVAERQVVLVERLRTQQAALQQDQARVLAQQAELTTTEQRLATYKQQVTAKVAQAKAELARLKAAERRALERASRDRERREIAAAQAASASSGAGSSSGSSRSSGSSGGRNSTSSSVAVGPGGTVNCGGRTVSAPTSRAAKVLAFACAQLGEPYRWGAEGPGSWDCSGFTMMAWRAGGVSLPHSSRMQYSYGSSVSRSSLRPGDLVFFYSPISHVGIYVGDGLMIAAPSTGDVVKISAVYGAFVGGRRL